MNESPADVPRPLPAENVARGTLLALVAIPVGIALWVVFWQFGLIASIVAFGIAIGALWLYRIGSGGRVGLAGAIRIVIITVVALVGALAAGLIWDVLPMYANQRNLAWLDAVTDSGFWSFLRNTIENHAGDLLIQLLLALVFGVLGCYTVVRTAIVQSRAA